jgi:hypothetical protein
VLFRLQISTAPGKAKKVFFQLSLFLLLCVTPGLSQKAHQEEAPLPKYDLNTKMKTKGVVDEVNPLLLGTRKDFTEVIIKSGNDKMYIYVCPKPFQEELGVSFSKGDEIAATGSKVKQETADLILAREVVKGAPTPFCSVTTRASLCGSGAPASDCVIEGANETFRHD